MLSTEGMFGKLEEPRGGITETSRGGMSQKEILVE
jgi:hypothetical protein